MKTLIIFLIALFFTTLISAQVSTEKALTDLDHTNPAELVSLSENIPFNQAIEVLSKISEKLTGKKIVSRIVTKAPIGIEIKNMPYWKALTLITKFNNYKFEEKEDVVVVEEQKSGKPNVPAEDYADISAREVQISAILFEANVQKMREEGINWESVLSQNGLSVHTGLTTLATSNSNGSTNSGTGTGTGTSNGNTTGSSSASTQKAPEFTVSPDAKFTVGNFTGTLTGLFKFFENEELGNIISRPTITVRNTKQGRIQIGSDISIKQRDFAGNVIDKFYSTGTIIEVTPFIYNEDGIDYILLRLKVERSSAIPGQITTEIRKTVASTEVLLLNGEQTVIGGLLVNTTQTVRRGIPFLKDLPWWVLGIRFLTGYNSNEEVQKEVIIMIDAKLLPTLKERIKDLKRDKFFKRRVENLKELKYYKNEIKRFKEKLKERKENNK